MNKSEAVRSFDGRATVIDFFCGAGGFSEGFRQAGFKIVQGVEFWKPALRTHNANFGLSDSTKNILEYTDAQNIEESIPDTDVIIGSPPCVSFSLSNHGGNANKDLGIDLIKTFYRIIAVKKSKPNSVLRAWVMENVPNSAKSIEESYTFSDLGLDDWALEIGKQPDDIVLEPKKNGKVLRADDYGCSQARKRFICGEIIGEGVFSDPVKDDKAKTLENLFHDFPSPYQDSQLIGQITDPNYNGLTIDADQLHDHFYDTGVYAVEWEKAQDAKQDHSYMGKMAFPEDQHKVSRTIMATRSASTREALLYQSENGRKGDGEYRTPTVREGAVIMGFPITYQFYGNDESTKWRQVGNAVCVQLSKAIAEMIKHQLSWDFEDAPISIGHDFPDFSYLDSKKLKTFDKPPVRQKDSLFRFHPIKEGNMTVELTNKFDGEKQWVVAVFVGTGRGFNKSIITHEQYLETKSLLLKRDMDYMDAITKGHCYSYNELEDKNAQYGFNNSDADHPYNVIQSICKGIKELDAKEHFLKERSIRIKKDKSLSEIKERIPYSQLLSIYALMHLLPRNPLTN
ncbi:DNA cytosine methyltransferase [Bifidobacterium sp. ESL0775]|uniref:DNA cytosine methyltransferase n=1 Tax=Bifidobacterium sp. ESL0775 TaxID=2983230 RepID=UPI0023F89F7C|nr:DNA cytosine methyltransferase [Bifidobacterium sp. ESL0775]WEV69711.1 DNA cytosine methyltransferase [Bifidobacterium sp. ESL0775]